MSTGCLTLWSTKYKLTISRLRKWARCYTLGLNPFYSTAHIFGALSHLRLWSDGHEVVPIRAKSVALGAGRLTAQRAEKPG